MDIEKMSNIDISQDSVKSISDKCNHLKDLNKQIEQEEEKLSLLKNKARDMEERIIPEMMQGWCIFVEVSWWFNCRSQTILCSKIPESRVDEAFSWLQNRGYEDLIKNTITASFGRGQDNQVSELIKVCEDNGFAYNKKEKVEPMTLKAL